jgi:hypothetical protein
VSGIWPLEPRARRRLDVPPATGGRRFALSVVGEIVEQTGGYPYVLRLLGAYVWPSFSAHEVSSADTVNR